METAELEVEEDSWINCEEFLDDVCTEPEIRLVDEIYESLLPLIVEEWKQDDEPSVFESEEHIDKKSSDSSFKTIYFGKVEVKFKNGNTYSGTALGKRFHGEGKFRWSDGTIYEGTFQKNHMLGYGSFYYSNAARYTGQVSLGHRHGKGSYTTDTFTYSGSFWNTLFHGVGKLQANHRSFDGEFKCNKIYLGTRIYENGIFVGIFDDFGYRKCGKFLFKNNDSYQGHWHEDQFCDYGVYKWNNPDKYVNKVIQFKPMSYTGYWLNGKRYGVGMLEFDERSILCNWEFDCKNGPGLILAANGDIFVSDQMYLRDHFMNGRKINQFKEAEHLIQELLYYFYPKSSDNDYCRKHCNTPIPITDEILKTRSESFTLQIQNVMPYTKQCASPLMPIFLPNYAIDFSESIILNVVFESFPNEDREKLINVEVKCINQVIISNLAVLEALYRKYATFNVHVPRDDVILTRSGLWQFYRDIFNEVPKYNVSDIIDEVDSLCHLIPRDSRNPCEIVYFWQFLKHLLFIVVVLNRYHGIRQQALHERLPFFGLFATMFMIFMREISSVVEFSLMKTNELIKERSEFVMKLLELIREHEDTLTIRSVYRFYKKYSSPDCKELNLKGHLSRITDAEFVNCAHLIFPCIIKDDCLIDISFSVTPLEFLEILLRLFEFDILKMKLDEWLKAERDFEARNLNGELLSKDTSRSSDLQSTPTEARGQQKRNDKRDVKSKPTKSKRASKISDNNLSRTKTDSRLSKDGGKHKKIATKT